MCWRISSHTSQSFSGRALNISVTLLFHTVAPLVRILGDDKNWYVGQKDVRLECGAKANPPARNFTWMRSVTHTHTLCGSPVKMQLFVNISKRLHY